MMTSVCKMFWIILLASVTRKKVLGWTQLRLSAATASSVRYKEVCLFVSEPTTVHDQVSHKADASTFLIENFVSKVTDAIETNKFLSMTLKGPKKGRTQTQKEELRGCLRQLQGRLIKVKKTVMFQATIKYHGATDVAKNWSMNEVQRQLHSLLDASPNNKELQSEWGKAIFPIGSKHGIQGVELCTTDATWEWNAKSSKKPVLKKRKALSRINQSAAPAAHDRAKQVPLPLEAPFLQKLGLTNKEGKPRRTMSSKLKQCQKFLEIVAGLVENSSAEKNDSISVVDMGCGRGYLTFSLHSYLVKKYANVRSFGIDVRPKLVSEMNEIAASCGSDFSQLSFERGAIGDNQSPNAFQSNSLNVLIALHACDTATDDALWCGIKNNTNIIVVAPCCHKEVRPQLDAVTNPKHPLAEVLRHGIYRERLSETVTDSIRALLLEMADYNTQVFEFVGGEHTSKNVMITAVKRQRPRSDKELEELRLRLRSLAALHGISRQRLAKWVGETLSDAHPTKIKLSPGSMHPL